MPVQVSYPGVYVQEMPSGVHTIAGVSTSVGMFLGRAKLGELWQPVECVSLDAFERAFSLDYADSDLARSVRLFFANGGPRCYVMRIADATAKPASLILNNEGTVATLTVEAKSAGLLGNDIRVAVNYDTPDPESTFNLEVFRWVKQSNGTLAKSGGETYLGLSMDVAHPRYCEDVVNLNSRLIKITDPNKAVALAGTGYSLSTYALSSATATNNAASVGALQTAMQGVITPTSNAFQMSVAGAAPVLVTLPDATLPAPAGNNFPNYVNALKAWLEGAINTQISAANPITVTFLVGPGGPAAQTNQNTRLIQISCATGDVSITPAPSADLAGILMLGTAQGGIEVSRAASRRPAANGVVFNFNNLISPAGDYISFAAVKQTIFDIVKVDGAEIGLVAPFSIATTPAPPVNDPRLYQDASATTQDDGRGGVREKLGLIAAAITAYRANNPTFEWTAEVWGSRLALRPAGAKGDNATTTIEARKLPNPSTLVAGVWGTPLQNVRYYALAAPVAGTFFSGGVSGNDGGPPTVGDYDKAYKVIDREVDIFNLLVLPRDAKHTSATVRTLWGPASVFCQRRRAFLIMDPPDEWTSAQDATDVSKGVNTLRVGLVKDYSGVYFPNLKIDDNGKEVIVGPSGAIAGLMGRIDGTRGVWKAAAGTEADIRGIRGVQYRFSDPENGSMNPKAVNTIRAFPNGILSWGARTMDGDDSFGSEYKYIPIRRLALFIEESLYRGLTWAVFEPNDEPLWASIRLNVGAFMNNLFRQGAFQGQTPRDAYFVKCDANTTTQNDRDLGIVNIIVGFAPLKPAEFVVLYLQQMAGQIQV